MRRQTPPKKLHSWFPMLPTRSASQSRLKSSIIEQFPRCTQACTSTHRPDNSHINPLLRAWAAPPTFIFKSLRSTKQVTACNMGFTREQHAITAADLPKVQTTSPTTAHFQLFSAKWSAVWAHPSPAPGITGAEGAGGPGVPSRGARGRWRGLAGQRAEAPNRTSTHKAPQVRRARAGFEARRRTK